MNGGEKNGDHGVWGSVGASTSVIASDDGMSVQVSENDDEMSVKVNVNVNRSENVSGNVGDI